MINQRAKFENIISRVINQRAKLKSTEECFCKIYGKNFRIYAKFVYENAKEKTCEKFINFLRLLKPLGNLSIYYFLSYII